MILLPFKPVLTLAREQNEKRAIGQAAKSAIPPFFGYFPLHEGAEVSELRSVKPRAGCWQRFLSLLMVKRQNTMESSNTRVCL